MEILTILAKIVVAVAIALILIGALLGRIAIQQAVVYLGVIAVLCVLVWALARFV